MKRVAFIIPYPLNEAPSQRFRFEQYFQILTKAGYSFKTQSFLNVKSWRVFFSKGNEFKKLLILIFGFVKRIIALFSIHNCEFVFIHREATPIGPPVFEWIIANILRKKIIYDFDDAIWLTDRINEPPLLRLLKWRSKVGSICRWSYKVSCGNRYLQEYALQFNPRSMINPTTIDCETMHAPKEPGSKEKSDKLVIGWTGSHSTLKYLNSLEPVLQKLEREFNQITFLVIADQPPSLNLERMEFIPWNAETEIEDLSRIDIGIMPLPDDEWTKGKCGFKALQYMALEIPAVVSNVGVNTNIISHRVEGFLCSTEEEWLTSLRKLISNPDLRISSGRNGRKKVLAGYSVTSNTARFLSLFE